MFKIVIKKQYLQIENNNNYFDEIKKKIKKFDQVYD